MPVRVLSGRHRSWRPGRLTIYRSICDWNPFAGNSCEGQVVGAATNFVGEHAGAIAVVATIAVSVAVCNAAFEVCAAAIAAASQWGAGALATDVAVAEIATGAAGAGVVEKILDDATAGGDAAAATLPASRKTRARWDTSSAMRRGTYLIL